MHKFKAHILVKVIGITLSILLVWQGVVWANPDIFKRGNINTQTLSPVPFGEENFSSFLTNYFLRYLDTLELELENGNVEAMKKMVVGTLGELSKTQNIPTAQRAFIEDIVSGIKGDETLGEFIIDCGYYKVRYYNPEAVNVNADPDEKYQLMQETRIGMYLHRQMLIQKESEDPEEGGHILWLDPTVGVDATRFFDDLYRSIKHGSFGFSSPWHRT